LGLQKVVFGYITKLSDFILKMTEVLFGLQISRNSLEQKFSFEIGTLNPYGINERFSFNQFILVFFVFFFYLAMFPPIA